MDTYDWLLFLHVLGAFGMIAAATFFWVLILATWKVESPATAAAFFRITRPADIVVQAGSLLTVVFGIWLAVHVNGYELWDGWILGGLVGWAIASGAGMAAGKEYYAIRDRLAEYGEGPSAELRAAFQTRRGLLLHAASTAALLVVLALMIFKPGA